MGKRIYYSFASALIACETERVGPCDDYKEAADRLSQAIYVIAERYGIDADPPGGHDTPRAMLEWWQQHWISVIEQIADMAMEMYSPFVALGKTWELRIECAALKKANLDYLDEVEEGICGSA